MTVWPLLRSGGALVAEREWRLGLPGVRGKKRLAKREGLRRGPLQAQQFKLRDCFFYSRAMAPGNPPQHHVSLRHALKPFLASAHNLHMGRFVDVIVQRRDILPNRHVDE